VTDTSAVVAFSVVTVVLLTMVSYMLYRRALEMGHAAGRVTGRLVVFWLGCLGALTVGMYFHHLYPEGLFAVNFTGGGGNAPLVLSGGPPPRGAVAGALLGMAAGALVAWLAVRPLQNPPPGGSAEGGP
jgi:hypothetical protein